MYIYPEQFNPTGMILDKRFEPRHEKTTVTAKLICAFVFAYAKCWFSHDVTHLSRLVGKPTM